jgi:hypothetical protein
MPLLLAHGLVRRVRTIEIQVRPLGGDSFKVTLDATKPTVGEAKSEIARVQGTAANCQELYKVAERADGLAVREDDAEPELLEEEAMVLGNGETLAMAVKDLPLLWRTFPADRVALSEGGAVATQTMTDEGDEDEDEDEESEDAILTTSEIELTNGTHYWEVELLSEEVNMIFIGISRPTGADEPSHSIWTCNGSLFGNGKHFGDEAGPYKQGDRVGMLLDLDDGSLRFFKNGVQHGPGFPAGSVTGPVVHAVQMGNKDESVRLLPDAEAPIGS